MKYYGQNENKEEKKESLHDLIVIYLRTIDKLFLTKAFVDIQQAQMSKLRSNLCEKTKTFKVDSSKKITKKKLLPSYSSNNSSSQINNFNGEYISNFDNSCNTLNMNTFSHHKGDLNWCEKITNQTNQPYAQLHTPSPTKKSYLERTLSAPYTNCYATNSINGIHHQRDGNQVINNSHGLRYSKAAL